MGDETRNQILVCVWVLASWEAEFRSTCSWRFQRVKNKHSFVFVMICIWFVHGLCQFFKAIFIQKKSQSFRRPKLNDSAIFLVTLETWTERTLENQSLKKEWIEFPNFLATQYIELPAFMSDCKPKNTKLKRKEKLLTKRHGKSAEILSWWPECHC